MNGFMVWHSYSVYALILQSQPKIHFGTTFALVVPMCVSTMTTTRNYSYAFGFIGVVVDSRQGLGDCGSVWRDQLSQSVVRCLDRMSEERKWKRERAWLERECEQKHRLMRAFYYNLQPPTFVGSLLFVCLFACVCVLYFHCTWTM